MKAVMPTWKPRDQPTNQSTNQRKNRYQQKAATPASSHQGLYILNLIALNASPIILDKSALFKMLWFWKERQEQPTESFIPDLIMFNPLAT